MVEDRRLRKAGGLVRLVLSGAMLVGGCATQARPSPQRMRGTLLQVRTAEAEPVRADSRASPLLLQARSSYQQASKAMASGQYRRATLLLDQAAADAELAMAIAREEAVSGQADESERGVADASSGGQR